MGVGTAKTGGTTRSRGGVRGGGDGADGSGAGTATADGAATGSRGGTAARSRGNMRGGGIEGGRSEEAAGGASPTTATRTRATRAKAARPTAEQKARWQRREPIALTEMYHWIGSRCDLEPRRVQRVLAALRDLGCLEVGRKGSGEFTIPGFARFYLHEVPAQKAGPRINPITKQEYMGKSHPATREIRARVLAPISGMT